MIRIIFTLCILALSANKLYAMESQSEKSTAKRSLSERLELTLQPHYFLFGDPTQLGQRSQEFRDIVSANTGDPDEFRSELSNLCQNIEEINITLFNVLIKLEECDTQYENTIELNKKTIELKGSILKLMAVLEPYCSEKDLFDEDGNISYDAGYIYPEYGHTATNLLIRIDKFYKSI